MVRLSSFTLILRAIGSPLTSRTPNFHKELKFLYIGLNSEVTREKTVLQDEFPLRFSLLFQSHSNYIGRGRVANTFECAEAVRYS